MRWLFMALGGIWAATLQLWLLAPADWPLWLSLVTGAPLGVLLGWMLGDIAAGYRPRR